MANPLQRILRGGQAPAAPTAAPEPAPAEASAPGEDGATGHADGTREGDAATAAAGPAGGRAPWAQPTGDTQPATAAGPAAEHAPWAEPPTGDAEPPTAAGPTGEHAPWAEPPTGDADPATADGPTADGAQQAEAPTGHAEPTTGGPEPAAGRGPADAEPTPAAVLAESTPSWRVRGRVRRRLRYLRAARELALRDLGGLVFDLHRFGRERPDLVTAKLDALAELDRERRALQEALDDPAGLDVLRLPGLASCPRCGTLVGSDARFCSSCGGSLSAPAAAVAAPEAEPEHVPGAAAATSDLPGT